MAGPGWLVRGHTPHQGPAQDEGHDAAGRLARPRDEHRALEAERVPDRHLEHGGGQQAHRPEHEAAEGEQVRHSPNVLGKAAHKCHTCRIPTNATNVKYTTNVTNVTNTTNATNVTNVTKAKGLGILPEFLLSCNEENTGFNRRKNTQNNP